MKQYRKIVWILPFILVTVLLISQYQPMKENHVYQRELNLSEIEMNHSNESDDEKIIKKAKDALLELNHITIDDAEYYTSVEFQSRTKYYDVSDVVLISFYRIETNDIVYVLTYDTKSGKLVSYYNLLAYDTTLIFSDEEQSPAPLDTSELEKNAKEFLSKVTSDEVVSDGSELNEILFICNYKNTVDNTYYSFRLNSYSGEIEYFHVYQTKDGDRP